MRVRAQAFVVLWGCLLAATATAELMPTLIGVGRSDRPIKALVADEDFDLATPKFRILLVGTARDPKVGDRLENWCRLVAQSPQWSQRFAVSAIPNLLVDPPIDQPMVFPPKGNAYDAKQHVESIYAWRWIGLHGPDLVIVVTGDGPTTMTVPTADLPVLKGLIKQMGQLAKPANEPTELASALATHAPSLVAPIPAVTMTAHAQELTDLVLPALAKIGALPVSPARKELQQRLQRTPLEQAAILAKVYGQSLPTMQYQPAMSMIGRVKLSALTNDPGHRQAVEQVLDPYRKGTKDPERKAMASIGGFLLFAELAESAPKDQKDAWIELLTRAAKLGLDGQGRPLEVMPGHTEMPEAMFMGAPILASAAKLTNNPALLQAAHHQLQYLTKLDGRPDGLYRHSPLSETPWGRGNGFAALGMGLSLTYWPTTDANHAVWRDRLQQQFAALVKHQDRTGCWHQVIDRPESYREMTSTCMISIAMIRGMRQGWLDKAAYRPVVEKAFAAVKVRTTNAGELADVCTGTGKMKTLRDYYDRPAVLGKDERGGAFALLFAVELEQLRRELHAGKD